MRIAMIAPETSPAPPVRGDAVKLYIRAVASRIGTRHDVTVVSMRDDSHPAGERPHAVRNVRVDCAAGDEEAYLHGVLQFLSEETFDVIVVFNRPLNVLPVCRAAPGSRLVLALHDDLFWEGDIPPDMAAPTVRVLDWIVTVNRYVADCVRARYPEASEKLQPLYAGVDLTQFPLKGSVEADVLANELRRELQLDGGYVVLSVGCLLEENGMRVLVDAFPLVRAEHPEANLVIVGSRWIGSRDEGKAVRALLRDAIKQDGTPDEGRIKFAGYVPPDQVHPFFAMADVFVSPSQEPNPPSTTYFEAMASGTPVVASERGVGSEVVQTGINGIVLDQMDEAGPLAAAIRELLDDPDKAREWGETGRRIAETRFTWDYIAERFERLLERAHANKRWTEWPDFSLESGVLAKPGEGGAALVDHALVAEPLRRLRTRTRGALRLIQRAAAHDWERVRSGEDGERDPSLDIRSTETIDRLAGRLGGDGGRADEQTPPLPVRADQRSAWPDVARIRERAATPGADRRTPAELEHFDPGRDHGQSGRGSRTSFTTYAEDDTDRGRRRRTRRRVAVRVRSRGYRRVRRRALHAYPRRIRIARVHVVRPGRGPARGTARRTLHRRTFRAARGARRLPARVRGWRAHRVFRRRRWFRMYRRLWLRGMRRPRRLRPLRRWYEPRRWRRAGRWGRPVRWLPARRRYRHGYFVRRR